MEKKPKLSKQGLRDVDATNRLIAAVQARECLWDRAYRGHRNRFKLERYWNEVAQEVGTTTINCRKKWKNLKDQCRKEFRKNDAESDWAHFQKLKFIHNQFKDDEEETNEADTNEETQFLDESIKNPKLGYTIRKKLLLNKRRNIELDIEKLIELVQQRDIIWNRQLKGHHNWYKLDECWKDIATELGVTRDEARLKWKYVRDQTRKECRKSESDWPMLPKLEFLINQFSNDFDWTEDRTIDNQSVEYPEDPNAKYFHHVDNDNTMEEVDDDQGTITFNFDAEEPMNDDTDEFDTKPVVTETDFNDEDGEFVACNPGTSREKTNKFSNDDEDIGFFNSLLPHIRQLGPARKMMLRMKIQELVYNTVYKT